MPDIYFQGRIYVNWNADECKLVGNVYQNVLGTLTSYPISEPHPFKDGQDVTGKVKITKRSEFYSGAYMNTCCLCKKQYKALIIIKKEPFIICPVEIKEYCQQRNIPILIYQEHFDSGATNEWTLVSYEIRGKKPKKVILENIDMLDKFTK